MIKMNLLAGGQAGPRRRPTLVHTICVLVTSVASAVYGVALEHSRAALQTRSVEADAQLTRASAVIKQSDDLRKRRDELLKTLGAVQLVLDERSTSSGLFEAVSRSLPEGVRLTAMKRSSASVQINGRAASLPEVTDLVHRLNASLPFARGAELRSVFTERSGDTEVLQFEIGGQLAPRSGNLRP